MQRGCSPLTSVDDDGTTILHLTALNGDLTSCRALFETRCAEEVERVKQAVLGAVQKFPDPIASLIAEFAREQPDVFRQDSDGKLALEVIDSTAPPEMKEYLEERMQMVPSAE